jgi:transposase
VTRRRPALFHGRHFEDVIILRASGGTYLKRHYEKIKARRGTGKAIIALARKLLGIIYRTLKNKWVFEDFPNFVLAEAA